MTGEKIPCLRGPRIWKNLNMKGGETMNKKRLGILIALLVVPLFLTVSCCTNKKVVKPTPTGGEKVKQTTSTKQQKSGVQEEVLTTKKYPGIQGEFMESKYLKDIHFDFDKYNIRPDAAAILKKSAKFLMDHPTYRIQIEGHCDERGSVEYNLVLGERRAESAKKFLMNLGVDGNRLSTISYGKEMPLDPRHTPEAWAKNRRCHFIILEK